MKNELHPLIECFSSPGIYEHKLVDEGYKFDFLRRQNYKFRPDLSGKVMKECGPIVELENEYGDRLYTVTDADSLIKNGWEMCFEKCFITRHYRSFGGATASPIDMEPVWTGPLFEAFDAAKKFNTDQVVAVVHRERDQTRNTNLDENGWF